MTISVAVFAMVMAYVALVAAYFALRTLAKLRRATTALARGTDGRTESIIEATDRNAAAVAVLGEQLGQLHQAVEATRAYVDERSEQTFRTLTTDTGAEAGAIRNVALVRYDAFREMSGRMSFSLALLDDAGGGVAISAVCGAGDTRVYAKSIVDGRGEHDLSPEEEQAVDAALQRRRKLLHRKAG